MGGRGGPDVPFILPKIVATGIMSVVSLTLLIEREPLSGDTGMAVLNYELLEQHCKMAEGLGKGGLNENLPHHSGAEGIMKTSTPLHCAHEDKNMIVWHLSSKCKESYFTNSII